MPYEVKITPEGLRHLGTLPEKVRAAVLETIVGSIAENPSRVGKALHDELEGLFSARRSDYRVVYEIREETHMVVVHRVQHQRAVYRPR